MKIADNPLKKLINIQSAMRGFLGHKYMRKLKASSLLNVELRKFMKYKDLRRLIACKKILFACRRFSDERFVKVGVSSLRIQRGFKKFLACKTVTEAKKKKQSLGGSICRGKISRQLAATKIQARIKGLATRRAYLNVRNAVNVIAKNYRKAMVHRVYVTVINAAIFIQSSYRRYKQNRDKPRPQEEPSFFISSRTPRFH